MSEPTGMASPRHTVPAGLDAIYVTASRRDGRFTRMCVASIRHFYPEAPVVLLRGGALQAGLQHELQQFWNVRVADLGPRADWGYGFVKLEPLFRPPGERFLVLDSDLVLAGPVLDLWSSASPQFVVDNEEQNEPAIAGTYYDWHGVRAVDPGAVPPAFVFNTGQWFGTSGVLSRDDFAPWLDWTGAVPRLRHPDLFKSGEQGLLNYVINRKAAGSEITIERRKIMHWPGQNMHGLTPASIASAAGPPLVIHWAGLKRRRIETMAGGDILAMFERLYYARLTWRSIRSWHAHFDHHLGELAKAVRHRWQRSFG